MNFNPERGGEGQFGTPETPEDEMTLVVGPAEWQRLAEMGGGVEKVRVRGRRARRGIRRDTRERVEKDRRFADVVRATSVLAEAAAERRLEK